MVLISKIEKKKVFRSDNYAVDLSKSESVSIACSVKLPACSLFAFALVLELPRAERSFLSFEKVRKICPSQYGKK